MKAIKQQTAVEWLYETLWKQTDFSLPSNIFDQAKAMEKEQIIDAYNNGSLDTYKKEPKNNQGTKYYTETYGS